MCLCYTIKYSSNLMNNIKISVNTDPLRNPVIGESPALASISAQTKPSVSWLVDFADEKEFNFPCDLPRTSYGWLDGSVPHVQLPFPVQWPLPIKHGPQSVSPTEKWMLRGQPLCTTRSFFVTGNFLHHTQACAL